MFSRTNNSQALDESAKSQSDSSKPRSTASALLGALALAVVTGGVVSASEWLTPTSGQMNNQTSANEPKKDKEKDKGDKKHVLPPDVAYVTLTADGFEPTAITHQAGRVRVVVQNQSCFKNLSLQLGQVINAQVLDVPGVAGEWRNARTLGEVQGMTKIVDMAPGIYRLTVANHPDWVCRITVQ